MKRFLLWSVVAALNLALLGCGGSSSSSQHPGSMAGAWDFTATVNGSSNFLIALEANLAQDNSGNISATGSATANGPTGNVSLVELGGSSLANVSLISIDYLGSQCNDDGTRKITGNINSSNQVNLTVTVGPSNTTITGTLNASATPAFSGTFKISNPGCNNDGMTGNVTGVLASSLTGNYAGTPVGNSSDNISLTLTAGSGNTLSGSGTDAQSGPFTVTGSSVGNAFTVTSAPSSGGSATTFYGYFDPQLGSKGSAFTAALIPGATSCPNGATLVNESCLFGIFAKQ